MGLVKTIPCNQHSVSTLESLLSISVEGPPLSDFNFEEACSRWSLASNRRVDVSHSNL